MLKTNPLRIGYPGWGVELRELTERIKRKYAEAGVLSFYNYPALAPLPNLATILTERRQIPREAQLFA